MPKLPNLEKWFDRMVRNRMHGPALATAGTAVGHAIMAAGLFPWGQPAQGIVLASGLIWVVASTFLFVASVALHIRKNL